MPLSRLTPRRVDGEAAPVVVQREGAGPDRLDPARGPGEAAERIEMQALDPTAGIAGAMPGERRDQGVGIRQARELEQVAGLPRQHAHRVADPAQPGVAEQALEGGRAGHADMDRQIAALGADHALPGEQRLGLEHELGDQPHLGRGPPGVVDLLVERDRGAGRAQLPLSFRMPGQADHADAVSLEQAGLE